jgi:hypothetical protein
LVRPSRRRGLRVEPDGQGAFRLIVRVPADEWAKLSTVSD